MLTRIETKIVHHYYLSIGIQFLEMRKQRKEITVNKKWDGNAVDGRQDSTLWLIYHASGAQAGAGGTKNFSKMTVFFSTHSIENFASIYGS